MKILFVGGGSGGHVTPIAALIKELQDEKYDKQLGGHNRPEFRVWCDRKFFGQSKKLMPNIKIEVIASGKFRRYANLKWWYRWFSPWHIWHTHVPNFIDSFKIMVGFTQSLFKLWSWRPDVVFCKGGYVSLPVGIVAHFLKIKLVIHDSDTVPGLTNRILARYADAIGTGSPIENYPSYPKSITKFIGIPINSSIHRSTALEKEQLKRALGLSSGKPLVLITGGGLGAQTFNITVSKIINDLTSLKGTNYSGGQVVLLSGKKIKPDIKNKLNKLDHNNADFCLLDFTDRFADYLMASDVVVTRSGATTMAELAAAEVATIIVPSPYLAGDHQTKNAAVYQKVKAALLVNEFDLKDNPSILVDRVDELLSDKTKAQKMAKNLAKFSRPHALRDMAKMILSVVGSN